MSHPTPHFTLYQKASLSASLLLVLARTFKQTAVLLWTSRFGVPFKRAIAIGYKRSAWKTLSYVQERYIMGTTGESIKKYCSSHRIAHSVVQLTGENPAALHFVDTPEKPAGRILLYIHGGGHVYPIMAEGHIDVALQCAKAAKASLVLLEYALAPENPYPSQLVQAVDALRWLLDSYKPDDLILGGDSAGGQTVLSLLVHLTKPSPYAPAISLGDKRIRGALASSPWVGFDYTAKSYQDNEKHDFLSRDAMLEITKLWNPKHEIWSDLLSVPKDTWQAAPVDRILLTVGTAEVFYDDVVELGKVMGTVEDPSGRVQIVKSKDDVHVGWIFNVALGLEPGPSTKPVIEWLEKL
ncbi:putative lipase thioesterase [Phaeomoniella chlamydospora]|uniref:Putative lipase thioesterase n=1 Tax=Phaeomoniella chlamydospora TaxID=158046 RepID=A0A0G2ESM4_PHACM|nr:putative lipase thioesterase [Phaeomoniella chlamydospora]